VAHQQEQENLDQKWGMLTERIISFHFISFHFISFHFTLQARQVFWLVGEVHNKSLTAAS